MTPFVRSVVEYATSKAGRHYVWQGKGTLCWTPSGLKPHKWTGLEVFDCSGLVTSAIHAAGGADWRGTHSAQTLWDSLEPAEAHQLGALHLYGSGPRGVTHVALALGGGRIVEAAGGDSRTLSPADAVRSKASVRVGWERRSDFLGARSLPALPRGAA